MEKVSLVTTIMILIFLPIVCSADRVSIDKSTGILIEHQSSGSTQEHLDTLMNNAISYGYNKNKIEVKFVTSQEAIRLIKAKIESDPGYLDKKEIKEIKKDLTEALVWQFRMIKAIWEVGVSKGAWNSSDIEDTELKQKYSQWNSKLNRLRELGE